MAPSINNDLIQAAFAKRLALAEGKKTGAKVPFARDTQITIFGNKTQEPQKQEAYVGYATKILAYFDKLGNNDGKVSKEEYIAGQKELNTNLRAQVYGGDERAQKTADKMIEFNAKDEFEILDQDKDGAISAEEFAILVRKYDEEDGQTNGKFSARNEWDAALKFRQSEVK